MGRARYPRYLSTNVSNANDDKESVKERESAPGSGKDSQVRELVGISTAGSVEQPAIVNYGRKKERKRRRAAILSLSSAMLSVMIPPVNRTAADIADVVGPFTRDTRRDLSLDDSASNRERFGDRQRRAPRRTTQLGRAINLTA